MKQTHDYSKRRMTKKLLLIVLIILLLATGGFLVYAKNQDRNTGDTTNNPDQPTSSDTDFSPPTEQEKQAGDKIKEDIAEKEQQSPDSTEGKKQVKPTITYAGQYGQQIEVGGYVPGIFEEGGTCTTTLTKGTASVTTSVKAVTNVDAVDCPAMVFQRGELSTSGTWQAVLSYSSPKAEGSSGSRAVEVK